MENASGKNEFQQYALFRVVTLALQRRQVVMCSLQVSSTPPSHSPRAPDCVSIRSYRTFCCSTFCAYMSMGPEWFIPDPDLDFHVIPDPDHKTGHEINNFKCTLNECKKIFKYLFTVCYQRRMCQLMNFFIYKTYTDFYVKQNEFRFRIRNDFTDPQALHCKRALQIFKRNILKKSLGWIWN